ncbi:hypothetical protein QEJ31_09325 [Pigmentibacter sp. JX0631]|uniref:hypothetical protein n=1 Tax=Pigmentibacter sp. JX0631 TaxID=2976982 RepID=UPI002468D50F|nr:hypothetical protein [Pigmentibacter sp. JX0631]WGL58729.1 hypothetical protein QEJ31_09325 [Pigmentibacter sp. JX0631]
MLKILLTILLSLFQFNVLANKLTLTICANDVRKSINPDAVYETPSVDIIKIAFKKLKSKLDINYTFDFKPMDRCVNDAEKGQIDAILDVSYTEERSRAVDYPPGSGPEEKEGPCTSLFRMTCSKYMVITNKNSQFEYKGNKEKLLLPVRVARGYSLAKKIEDIYKENAELSKNDLVSIKKLLRDNSGCVVANFGYIPGLAENQFRELLPKLKIHRIPYEARSNYFPFSKKTNITHEQKLTIWKELAKVMLDEKVVDQLRRKYSKLKYK